MGSKLARTPGVYLAGFMGSGKTTIGRKLADELGWPFVDLDDDIEMAAGCTITELFAVQGEQEFRKVEHEALRRRAHQAQCGSPVVVALGGGAFAQDDNRRLLAEAGQVVWLDAPLDLIRSRIEGETHRPLAKDPERFERLYEERRDAYAKADIQIAISDDDIPAIVERILDLLSWD